MLPCVQHQYFSWLLVCTDHILPIFSSSYGHPGYHQLTTLLRLQWTQCGMSTWVWMKTSYKYQIVGWISLISLKSAFSEWLHHSTLPPAMQNVTIFIALLNFGIFQLYYFCWFTRCKMVSHHFLKLNFSIFCISSSLINCQLIPFAHFSLGMVVFWMFT